MSSSKLDRVLFEIEEWQRGKLWGAASIAACAGVSVDTIYRWAEDPACPIKRIGGRYFCTRASLMAWMLSKDAA